MFYMFKRAIFLAGVLAFSVQSCLAAADSRSKGLGEERSPGLANIADLPYKPRSLLAKDAGSAPAPAPGPAGVKNLTTIFATVYGSAYNPYNDLTGGNVNSNKNQADYNECVIFGSLVAASCESDDRPVPACCTTQGTAAVCNTFDDGGRVTCSTFSQPYPACCENRNQPQSVCTLTASDSSCNNDYPVPACCDGILCSLFTDGDAVKCTGVDVARCCPS